MKRMTCMFSALLLTGSLLSDVRAAGSWLPDGAMAQVREMMSQGAACPAAVEVRAPQQEKAGADERSGTRLCWERGANQAADRLGMPAR